MIGHIGINSDFLNFIEKSHELSFFITRTGNIIYASSEAELLFGFSHAEYTQFNIRDIIHPEDLSALAQQMEQLLSPHSKPVHYELRCINKQGGYEWIEGTAANFLNEVGVQAIVYKFCSATVRKTSAQEQLLLINQLSKRKEELEQFVYIISHNLRTPLSNLTGLINILEEDKLDEYNKSIVSLFKSATNRLSETILDLTLMLNLKDKNRVEIVRIDFGEIFEKVCCSFREQIEELGIKLNYQFDCSHVLFNKSYMESILTNLLSNAIKYRDVNRALEVNINLLKDEQQNCVLTFADNGVGIDMEANKEELFGLHQRFHSHVNGNGVGLFITKSQVTSLGGTIEVSSKVNEGTSFCITFRGQLTG
jgi:PAS domain S-box-containing protein